jgi:hypothetical protein
MLVALGVLSACATLDVSLKPPAFEPQEYARSTRKGLELRAIAVEGVDRYWELFDDYLPEIGIAAVWAKLLHTGEADLDLSRSKWRLRFHGQMHASLSTEQVFRLYYKKRKIRFFRVGTDANARARFEQVSIALPDILHPKSERAGLLLFDLGTLGLEPGWSRDATLLLQNVRFGGDDKADLVLPLNHADTNR